MHSEASVLVVKEQRQIPGFNNKLVNMQAVRSAEFQPTESDENIQKWFD